jgi:hypothetical protein
MKKIVTLMLFVAIALLSKAQTKETLCSVFVFNGYGNEMTETTIFTQDGKYFIDTKFVDSTTTFGEICIGKSLDELEMVLSNIKYFLEHTELEYLLLKTNDDWLKLYREPDGDDDSDDDVLIPIITDGTESFSDIPIQLVDECLLIAKYRL